MLRGERELFGLEWVTPYCRNIGKHFCRFPVHHWVDVFRLCGDCGDFKKALLKKIISSVGSIRNQKT